MLKAIDMKFKLSVFALFSMATLFAQDLKVYDIVSEQVLAFNAGDVDRLVDQVSEDFKWYYIGSDTLLLELSGKEQFKANMSGYFSEVKSVHAEISEYAIDGNRMSFKEVVTYETVSGKKGSTSAMAVYEVQNDLIYRVWYFF